MSEIKPVLTAEDVALVRGRGYLLSNTSTPGYSFVEGERLLDLANRIETLLASAPSPPGCYRLSFVFSPSPPDRGVPHRAYKVDGGEEILFEFIGAELSQCEGWTGPTRGLGHRAPQVPNGPTLRTL